MCGRLIGAHVSIAGGLHQALSRGEALGCTTAQIFVKSPARWQAEALSEGQIEAFRQAREGSRIERLVAHAAYLINLACPDPDTLERSRRALAEELRRCDALGIDALVVHPGAHLGAGLDAGIARAHESLTEVLAGRDPSGTRLLLENTAGQGTLLGGCVEELADLLRPFRHRDVGLCLDTCHAFAAGYPLHRPGEPGRLLRRIEDLFWNGALGCIHLNDSQHPFASRRDRHANLGEGEIGSAAFTALVADPRTTGVPLILETPRGSDGAGHRRDLALLRRPPT